MRIDIIKQSYSKKTDWNDEYEKFIQFKSNPNLKEVLQEAKGPYPAGHGEDHVNKVIEKINLLFSSKKCHDMLEVKDVFNLLVAVCIHDIAIVRLIPLGNSGDLAEHERSMHSYEDHIKEIVKEYRLLELYSDRKEYILKLASAHANDKFKTVDDKLSEYSDYLQVYEQKKKWEILVRLICIADYLDLGENRLRYTSDNVAWNNIQEEHNDKHKHLSSPDITNNLIVLKLTSEAEGNVRNTDSKLQERLKILTIVQKVYYELEKHVINLNEALVSEWVLKPLKEDFFGRIFPLSYGINLYSTMFEKAQEKVKKNQTFKIDMLGHSLFSRFVDDKEKLNDKLFRKLKNDKVNLRVLLLDPDTELQQSCEIHDSQLEKDPERSILPLYDKNYLLVERGDILHSLDKIQDNWLNLGDDSLIKVKLTKKILYASIFRFGDYMVFTPYTMGLSSQSISIVYSSASPIFDAFLKDFEQLWTQKDETRLFLSKVGKYVIEDNPISEIVFEKDQDNNLSNFNYEKWLLNNERKERVKSWLQNETKIFPPYELEIQPTNKCNLNCTHCIGRHLDYVDLDMKNLEVSDIDSIKTLFKWGDEEGFPIERVRISGLNGDPLSGDALEFTKSFINQNISEFNKDIVLFTNGLNIHEMIDDLLKIESIHISLDAGTKETFMEMKGTNDFEKIIDNIIKLRVKKIEAKSSTNIGIGFVVTQRNSSEVEEIIKKADEIGVDFIRFKRDIHSPNSISWRTWVNTKKRIEKLKLEYRNIKNIYITNLPKQHWNGNTLKCMSYKYCLTVGADRNIYACDHLASKSYTSLANLNDEKLIENITNSLMNKNYCDKLKKCSQCPPFNYRLNYFLPQLKNIYHSGSEMDFDDKIDRFLN